MINPENKVNAMVNEPFVDEILKKIHLSFLGCGRKFKTDPEVEELRSKPAIELYEKRMQLQFKVKLQRLNTSKRAWRRNRYRQPYKKRLAQFTEAIRLSLSDAKFDAERDEQMALQNYYLENEPW